MKQINETWYEVQQPDGGGIDNEVLARFSTESEANKYKDSLGKGWPRYVRVKSYSIVIYDSCEELLESKSEKKRIQQEISNLQEQLKSLS